MKINVKRGKQSKQLLEQLMFKLDSCPAYKKVGSVIINNRIFMILIIWVGVSIQKKMFARIMSFIFDKKNPDEIKGRKRSQIISLNNSDIIRYVM